MINALCRKKILFLVLFVYFLSFSIYYLLLSLYSLYQLYVTLQVLKVISKMKHDNKVSYFEFQNCYKWMVNIYLEERYVKSYSESLISEYNGHLSICTVIANWKDLSIVFKRRESGVLQPRYCKVQSIWFDIPVCTESVEINVLTNKS